MDESKLKELKQIARQIREDVICTSRDCVEGVHVGGSLSMAEILAALFFHTLKIDPKNPNWPERDRFVLSKGHGNVGLSSAMARRGYFSVDELKDFDKLGARLSMHIDRHRMPGVEISSGSLGHGLPVAVGMACAGKLDGATWRVYCLVGDGELMEGSMWEALMAGAHFDLNNLTVIVDRNRYSLDGPTEKIMDLEPLAKKFEAFGWRVLEVDGHQIEALVGALESKPAEGDLRPTIIIANTVKGKGIPFLENTTGSHFSRLKPEQAEEALAAVAQMD